MAVKSLNVLSFVHNFTKLGVTVYIHFYRIFVSSQNLYVQMKDKSALLKEAPESSLPPAMWGHIEKDNLPWTRRQGQTSIWQQPDPVLPRLPELRSKYWLFTSHLDKDIFVTAT